MLPLERTLDIQTSPQEQKDDFKADHKRTLKGRFVTKNPNTNVWATVAKVGMCILPLMLVPVHLYQQAHLKNKEPSSPPEPKPQQQSIPPLNLTVSKPIKEEIEKLPSLSDTGNNELKDEPPSENGSPLLNFGLCCLIVCLGIKIFNNLLVNVHNHNDKEDRELKLSYSPIDSSDPNLNNQKIKDEDLEKKLHTVSAEFKAKLEKIEKEASGALEKIRDKIISAKKTLIETDSLLLEFQQKNNRITEIISKRNQEIKDFNDCRALFEAYRQLSKPNEIYSFAIDCIEKLKDCPQAVEKAYKQIIANAFDRLNKERDIHACKLAIHCIDKEDALSQNISQNALQKLLKTSAEHALAFAIACIDRGYCKFITRTTFQQFQAKSLDSAFSFGLACIGKSDHTCISNEEQATITFQRIDKQNNFTTDYTLRFAKECINKNAYDAVTGPYNFLRENHFKSAQALVDWCKENPENQTCSRIVKMHEVFYQGNDQQTLTLR